MHNVERWIPISTLEATVSMLEVLSETDLLCIRNFAKCLFMSQGHENSFRPLTKGQIIAQPDESAKQYAHGQFSDADSFADEIMEKYGLKGSYYESCHAAI